MSSQANSDKILFLLKRKGPQTAKMLAECLSMTSMGARQHVLTLQEQGLVSSFDKSEKVGRPSQFWQLTSKAQLRFPDSHSQLTLTMLNGVRDIFGAQGLEQLIQHREKEMQTLYFSRVKSQPDLESKVRELVAIRNQEGYMAEFEYDENGVMWLYENHCPICDAATQCQNFCRSELDLFTLCLGDTFQIERMEHILQGARRCAYRIEVKSKIR